MSDMEQYASYFSIGMKVGVVFPMAAAESFRDWAVIHDLDEDLVTLQLSRDQLPEGVVLHVGQILELRGGREGAAYSCRAIIVSEGEAREILLRLIGEIVTDELREFYRIDAFLPIKYYITHEQRPEVLETEWKTRRRQRMDEELQRRQQRWDSRLEMLRAELPQEPHQEQPHQEGEEPDLAWDTIIPLAANISGGGIRIVTHQGFGAGEYLPLEILVPSPRRLVDAIGQVIFANRTSSPGDRESFSVAIKFIFIDERDRDAIVNHIANVQLKRIRQLRERFALRNLDGEGEAPPRSWKSRLARLAMGLVLAAVLFLLGGYFRGYVMSHPKSEIEETFEQGIKKYLQRLGR